MTQGVERDVVPTSAVVTHGDCVSAMAAMPEASVDAIVTDPPYGLGFMGKAWDALPPGIEWAAECLRVLKPGGHLLAFGGTRTYHRLVCAIEDAGLEIRDTIAWLYGTGFPKSLDVSKAIDKAAGAKREVVGPDPQAARRNRNSHRFDALYGEHDGASAVPITAPATPEANRWSGWGTAVKPAHEPIVVARKPLVGTVAGNVLSFGTGGMNIDACRIGADGESGRWPANVVLDEHAAIALDRQTGTCRGAGDYNKGARGQGAKNGAASIPIDQVTGATYADSGGASRFLYVAKSSTAERSAGLDSKICSCHEHDDKKAPPSTTASAAKAGSSTNAADPVISRGSSATSSSAVCADCGGVIGGAVRNTHPLGPTVKPIALMRWLVRLVTPPGGTVLDPFAGSGTTGIAAVLEGFAFVGIEREADYVAIAEARIAYWQTTDGVSRAGY